MCYNAYMNEPTNDNEDFAYDSCLDELTEQEAIAELMEEGYSEEEAKRMIGDYDADEYCYDDDTDRDVPDFMDGGDFE